MADLRLLCGRVLLGVLVILFVSLCTIYSIYKYILDKNWDYATYRNFHRNKNDIYPSFSLCIHDNDKGENPIKLFQIGYSNKDSKESEETANDTTIVTYQNFLAGRFSKDQKCLWNEGLSDIDYDTVTLAIEDYVLKFSLSFKNGSIHCIDPSEKGNDTSSTQSSFSWPPKMYISRRDSEQKCLTVDVPYFLDTRIHSFGNLFNNFIFGEQSKRPRTGGFSVKLHYPQQMFVVNAIKDRWPFSHYPEQTLSAKGLLPA